MKLDNLCSGLLIVSKTAERILREGGPGQNDVISRLIL